MKFEQSADNEANFQQSAEPVLKGKKYDVIFRENRTFELHLRKTTYHFGPHECKRVDQAFLDHPDFIQQKNYFVIKEVSK